MESGTEPLWQRELEVAREITQAFLTAAQPLEVYRLALARVLPLVNATFASVFLREENDPDLLRLVCAQNWPQASARFLSQLRIRVGRGPTGRAVAENAAVAVEDVFVDPTLREWWEPAHEIGFASLISLPLRTDTATMGALSFYFEKPHDFRDDEVALLSLIADQLSATAERAHRMESLEARNRELERRIEEMRGHMKDAEEARRLKDEFLANMSHELRTPLSSILGYAYLLHSGNEGELTEAQSSIVRKIEHSGSALQRLITDLLDLSQLKLGRTAMRPTPGEAVQLFEQAAAAVGDPPEGVELRVETPDGRIPVTTDGEKVVKILENLLSNAYKFMTKGEVRVTVRQQRGFAASGIARRPDDAASNLGRGPIVEWVVEDGGIGIEPDDMESIFDEFRQVDGSSTRLYGGTGLGLALSLRLARLLRGEILVASEPGEGSTFTLRLPASPATGIESKGAG